MTEHTIGYNARLLAEVYLQVFDDHDRPVGIDRCPGAGELRTPEDSTADGLQDWKCREESQSSCGSFNIPFVKILQPCCWFHSSTQMCGSSFSKPAIGCEWKYPYVVTDGRLNGTSCQNVLAGHVSGYCVVHPEAPRWHATEIVNCSSRGRQNFKRKYSARTSDHEKSHHLEKESMRKRSSWLLGLTVTLRSLRQAAKGKDILTAREA